MIRRSFNWQSNASAYQPATHFGGKDGGQVSIRVMISSTQSCNLKVATTGILLSLPK
jgi:hypothetical protein